MSCFTCCECYYVVDCGYGDIPSRWYPIPNCLPADYNLCLQTPVSNGAAAYVLIFEKENGVSTELALTADDACYGGGCPMVKIPGTFLSEFLQGYDGFMKVTIRYGSDYDLATFDNQSNCPPDPYELQDETYPSCLVFKIVNRKMAIETGWDDNVSWTKKIPTC